MASFPIRTCDESFVLEKVDAPMAEQQAFGDSVAQHLPFLNRLVRKLTRGDEIADDMVQQTMLKALTKAHQFRFESSLKTWLVSIAVNEVHQAYRSVWQRRAVPLTTETPDVGRCQRLEFPDKIYGAEERDFFVREAVARLPQMYRSVVELCDFHCLPLSEAARKLGLTLPAIKTRRRRARRKLRPLLEKLNRS